MKKQLNKDQIQEIVKSGAPGTYAVRDGTGLCLIKGNKHGHASWSQRLRIKGQDGQKTIGLGDIQLYPTLSKAQDPALQNKALAKKGIDPRFEIQSRSTIPTFLEFAKEVLGKRKAKFKRDRTFKAYETSCFVKAKPIHNMPISDITLQDIKGLMKKQKRKDGTYYDDFWKEANAAAKKFLDHLKVVFRSAKRNGYIATNFLELGSGDAMEEFGYTDKVAKHHDSIHYSKVADIIESVKKRKGNTIGLCMKFITLTCCRSGEAREARWEHINLEERVWNIPSTGTKQARFHDVPLSYAAIEVLKEAYKLSNGSGLVFPAVRSGSVMRDNVVSRELRIEIKEQKLKGTVHGLRTSFHTWATEVALADELSMNTFGNPEENPSNILIELCLGHKIGTPTMQAYFRSTMKEERKKLMDAWGEFLYPSEPTQDNVIEFKKTG